MAQNEQDKKNKAERRANMRQEEWKVIQEQEDKKNSVKSKGKKKEKVLGSCRGVIDEENSLQTFSGTLPPSTDEFCFTKLRLYFVKILITVFSSLKLPPKLCHNKSNYY